MVRRVSFLFLLTVVWVGVSAGQVVEHNDAILAERTKKEVLKVEQELNHAVLKKAGATLDHILADEMVWLTSTGEMLTKAQVLADIQSGNQTEFSIKADDRQLSVYGDTVVLYSTARGRTRGAIKDESSTRKVTEVFVKLGGQWKIVARGETLVAKQ